MNAMASTRLDRAGRRLVVLGATLTVVLAAPALVFALVVIPSISCGWASSAADCGVSVLLEEGLAAAGVAVAVVVTVVMMLRGGTTSLALGGIAAFIVGVVGTLLLLSPDGRLMVVLLAALVAPGAFVLAIGAAFRLTARGREQRGP